MSLTAPSIPVTPDLIRGPAFLCNHSSAGSLAKESLTPDQVRRDDVGKVLNLRAFVSSREPNSRLGFSLTRGIFSREAAKTRRNALFAALGTLEIAACSTPSNQATQACEVFIKERLRSPSTYRLVKADFSGTAIPSESRMIKFVTVQYDAANAYGTPIRGEQMCSFEVDNSGEFVDDLEHAARMSAITTSEYAPCCLLEKQGKPKLSDPIADAERAADEAMNVADDAMAAANEALQNADFK